MTIAKLIHELQSLDVDPNTPVRFYANEYDADEPLINLLQIGGPKRGYRAVGFHVHSDELESILESALDTEW